MIDRENLDQFIPKIKTLRDVESLLYFIVENTTVASISKDACILSDTLECSEMRYYYEDGHDAWVKSFVIPKSLVILRRAVFAGMTFS